MGTPGIPGREASGSAAHAGNPGDRLDGANALHDAGQVDPIPHPDDYVDGTEPRGFVVHVDPLDAGISRSDAGSNFGDGGTTLLQIDAQFGVEFAGDLFGPAQRDDALGAVPVLGDVVAAVGVHHHALLGADVAHDGVASAPRRAWSSEEHTSELQ